MSDNILPANTDTCLVEFDKKEYAIVGDLFFAKRLEEVPPWFLELVQDTVVSINGNTYDALAQYNLSLLAALQSIEVSKNTYEQYITKLITDEAAFVSVLTTLNSTINENDATIRQLLLTYATQDFAVASAAQLLTASLNGGAIGAKIGSVESAMATQYGAMAQRLQTLESTFDDVSGQQSANASAIQALTTYTGYGVYNGADALIANSSFKTDLDAYLAGTDYNVGGSSTLLQDVTAISTEQAKIVEAKFEYGSRIELDGRVYNAGFGLVQTGTLLPDGVTYDSEFWVRANKFKFVNDSGGVMTTPFQVVGNTVLVGWDSVTGTNRPADGATRNVNRGEWVQYPTNPNYYMQGDFVQYNGSSYTCILSTIPGSASPNPTNTNYWILLASKGIPGADGADGSAGINARAVSLVAANGGVFTYNSAGLLPSPTSTVVTATAVNTTGTVYYEFFVNDVSAQNTTSNTYTVTAPSSLNNSKIEVQIREGASTGTVLSRDQLTIVGIKPGVNAFTVVLTNEAHTLPVNNGVVTYTGSGTTIKVYEGSTELTYGTTGNGTFSVTAVGSGISVGNNTNGVFSDHSNMTANNATVTYTVTVRSSTGVVSTLTKIQSLAKSLQGINGLNKAVVSIYYKNTSSSVAPTASITGPFTYTFSTSTFSGGVLNGWTTTLPTVSSGEYIWVRQATASSLTNTDTIDAVEFSAAVCLSGVGVNGLNTATVYLYAVNTSNITPPSAFSGTFTYTFATGVLSGGVLNGWSQSVPTIPKGSYLWVRQATATNSSTTDSIDSSEFSSAVVISGVGNDGTNGVDGAPVSTVVVVPNSSSSWYAAVVIDGIVKYRTQTVVLPAAPSVMYTTNGSDLPPTSTDAVWYNTPPLMDAATNKMWARLYANGVYYIVKIVDLSAIVSYDAAKYRGTYNSGTLYNVGDVVVSGNYSYIAKLASTGAAVSNTSYWAMMAATQTATTFQSYDVKINDITNAVSGTNIVGYRPTGTTAWITFSSASTALFTQLVRGICSAPVYNDSIPVNVYNTAGTTKVNASTILYTNTAYYDLSTYSWNSGNWLFNVKLAVTGDALITGSLTVDKISSDSFGDSLNLYSNYTGQTGFTMAVYGSNDSNKTNTANTGVGGYGFYGLAGVGKSAGVIAGYTGLSDNSTTNAAFLSTSSWSGDFRHGLVCGYNVGTLGAGGSNLAKISTSTHAGYFAGPVYSQSTVTSFTGGHEVLLEKHEEIPSVGDIVVDYDMFTKIDVSNTITVVSTSKVVNEKGIVGVFAEEAKSPPGVLLIDGNVIDSYYANAYSGYTTIIINSLGEGQVNVCGMNGNIELGDLITTSSIPGKGMKQDDDIVKNYTVGKARESVTFDYPEQVKQIACIYMCG